MTPPPTSSVTGAPTQIPTVADGVPTNPHYYAPPSALPDLTAAVTNLTIAPSTTTTSVSPSISAPVFSTQQQPIDQDVGFVPPPQQPPLFSMPITAAAIIPSSDLPQIPMYSPYQFANGDKVTAQPSHPAHVSYATMNSFSFEPPTHAAPSTSATAPAPFNPALLSYPAASFVAPSSVQQFPPPMQMYSTYPQVQGGSGGGTAVTTPISLPGMPPITVSATLPPQALEGFQFNNNSSNNQVTSTQN